MASVGLGRESNEHPWHVVVILGNGPTGVIYPISVDDALNLANSLQEYALKTQERNRKLIPQLRLINGEGSSVRNDAPSERHLRSV